MGIGFSLWRRSFARELTQPLSALESNSEHSGVGPFVRRTYRGQEEEGCQEEGGEEVDQEGSEEEGQEVGRFAA